MWGFPYKRGGEARCLAKGCNFEISDSLRVFRAKKPVVLVAKVSFKVARDEI